MARLELTRTGIVEATAGIRGFRLVRLGGSSFHGFVRDEYTTLPDITNRPLHMWLDLEWRYMTDDDALQGGAAAEARPGVFPVRAGAAQVPGSTPS